MVMEIKGENFYEIIVRGRKKAEENMFTNILWLYFYIVHCELRSIFSCRYCHAVYLD